MTTPKGAKLSQSVLAAVRDVAERVILPRFKSLTENEVRSKTHPRDLVTVADEEAERDLTRILGTLLPGSRVVGEESVAKDPALLDSLDTDEPVWIIDPIDGTANFVNGSEKFAVVVALVCGGETVMGWIHNPTAGTSIRAEQGGGSWVAGGTNEGERRQRIYGPPAGDLSEMTAALHHRDLSLLKGKFGRITRLGSAAHDYWSLAEGDMQVLCYRRLKPWDHAAGLLIHEEAGGYNRLLSGERYSPRAKDQMGLLCAPNAQVWQCVADLVSPEIGNLGQN